jgi:hypothetical protein
MMSCAGFAGQECQTERQAQNNRADPEKFSHDNAPRQKLNMGSLQNKDLRRFLITLPTA